MGKKPHSIGLKNIGSDLFQFKIFPNPAEDKISVYLENSGNHFINIYDIQGKKLLAETLTTDGDIDVTILSTGVYIIELITTNGIHARKLFIQ